MYKALYAYPWDFVDEGVDEVLERVGEAGLDTVNVAMSYHAGKFLRPHSPKRKIYFPEDGTVYFRPDFARYNEIKPRPNSVVGDQDVLELLTRRAQGVGIAAWVVCLHNTPLGMEHPAFTVRNAYGDPYPYSLCPSHPEVRQYVVSLCADMASRYALEGLVLETPGFLPFEHGFHHEFQMVRLYPWAQILLALCFCDGCKRAAEREGVDFAGLRERVRLDLDAYLAAGVTAPEPMALWWWLGDLVWQEEWLPYLRLRCRLVTELVREVRAALPSNMPLAVIPGVQRPTASTWLEGSDLHALAQAADALEILAYHAEPSLVRAELWDVRRRLGGRARLHAVLRPSHPDLVTKEALLAAVAGLKGLGLEGLAFYNYGFIPLENLSWIRDALSTFEEA
jgi:hypothetical protein